MRSVIESVKVTLRPISVPFRRVIHFDKFFEIYTYIKGVNSAHRNMPGGLLNVNNSSGGFLERLVELALLADSKGPWLLVSEPKSAPEEIRTAWLTKYGVELPEIIPIEELLHSNWNAQEFQYDLCKDLDLKETDAKFAVVLHQSLLEHVVDPITLIKNLNGYLIPGGVQVIQTVNIYASEHRFPIDTLRFFPDFFNNLFKYLSLQCTNCFVENQSIYAVLKKVESLLEVND